MIWCDGNVQHQRVQSITTKGMSILPYIWAGVFIWEREACIMLTDCDLSKYRDILEFISTLVLSVSFCHCLWLFYTSHSQESLYHGGNSCHLRIANFICTHWIVPLNNLSNLCLLFTAYFGWYNIVVNNDSRFCSFVFNEVYVINVYQEFYSSCNFIL